MVYSVDDVDRRIIRCLQDEPRASYAKIARQTSVSEATVRRRIAALIDSRVIQTAVLPDTPALGYKVDAYVGLKTEPQRTRAIAEEVRDLEDVMEVVLTTGRWDVLFYISAPSIEQLRARLEERVAPIPGVREMEPLLASYFLKNFSDWRVPLSGFGGNSGEPGSGEGSSAT
jgi:Lrp/AsnC family transcriptional regulator, regulator for asnA, asnC and gidA